MRSKIITLFLIGMLSAANAETLRVLNWSDYIDESFLEQFATQNGITIDYVTYEDVDQFDFQFFLEDQSFDVVFPPIDSLSKMIEREMVIPLNTDRLPNIGNIDPRFFELLNAYDPGNQYSLPYLWGTTGIGINRAAVAKALGVDEVPNSWSLVFDPAIAEKLSSCGISWLDSEIEMLPLALNYLGLDAQTTSRSDFRRAESELSPLASYVSTFTSEDYVQPFANGQLCVTVGYSGDIFQAIDEAAEGLELEYIIPKEGAFVWFDIVTITKTADVALAHKFVNALMAPETIAGITNYVWYANAIPASMPMIDEEIRTDPAIYPSEEVSEKLFGYPLYEDSVLRTMKRRWVKVKCAGGQECLVPIESIPTN